MLDNQFSRVALSVVGAFIFTVTAVGAAVGPARVAETTPVVYADAVSNVVGGANA